MAAKGSKSVTYLGPVAAADPTTVYVVPGEPGHSTDDLELRRGVTVDGVSADVCERLEADEAHDFKIGGKPSAADFEPWAGYSLLDEDAVLAALDDPTVTNTAVVAENVAAYEKAHDKRKAVVAAAEHQAKNYRAGEPAPEAEADGANEESK